MNVAQPGWYPDPAGTPQTYRYFDGAQWSETTTTDPSAPPPGAGSPPPAPPTVPVPPASAPPPPPPTQELPEVPGAAPTQVGPGWLGNQQAGPAPGGYGDVPPPPGTGGGFTGGLSPMPPTSGGSTGGNGGKVALIAVAAVVLLLIIGLGGFFGVRALTGGDTKDDDRAADDQTSQAEEGSEGETEEPSDEPTAAPPSTPAPGSASCHSGSPAVLDDQAGSDRLTGVGISMPRIDGYTVEGDAGGAPWMSPYFTWGYDVIAQEMLIESSVGGGWISMYAVGGVSTEWGSPEEAARAVMECMAPNTDFYSGYTGHEEVSSTAVDVAGAESAWSHVADIHNDDPDLTVTGDRAQVVVVDTGDDEIYGMYISVVPLDDTDMYAQQEEIADQLRVE